MTAKLMTHARLPKEKFLEVINCFAGDLTATETARLTVLNRNSVNNIFSKLRRRIYKICAVDRVRRLERLDIDRALLAPDRRPVNIPEENLEVRILVFYLKERAEGTPKMNFYETVHTEITYTKQVPVKLNELFREFHRKTNSNFFGFRTYPFGYFHPNDKKTNKIIAQYSPEKAPDFFYFMKDRMKKFNGTTSKDSLIFHLKESEWRINNRFKDLAAELIDSLQKNPL